MLRKFLQHYHGSHAEISVSDTGFGITPEFLPFVFDRFRQADMSYTRAHGGLGLGLGITRHLIELHGGTIEAVSGGPGRGSTFTVRLPLAATDARPAQANVGRRVAEGRDVGTALDGLRVLVVDDEPDVCELLVVILKTYGAEVTGVTSAGEAFEALRRGKPDVLVCDLGMPGEDGFSLIRRVRALPPEEGGETPAAALTAYTRDEDRVRALDSGFQIHVPKPADPDEVAAVVLKLARGAPTA